jgi:hypothetical protein
MKAKQLLEYVNTQLEQGHSPLEKEVVLRVAGRDYAIRSLDASTSAIILEGGEEVIHEDTLPGIAEASGKPKGEGIEPPPPEKLQAISPGAEEGEAAEETERPRRR